MIFSPLLRDCRSPLQTAASCALYKCNHISAPQSGIFPPMTFMFILSSQKHLYFIPITSFLQPFQRRNRYKFIIPVYSAAILYNFTLFSHTTQYFNTFFHYPINRNRTASLEQNILFHTWPAERSVGPSLLFQKHLQYKSPLFEAAAGVEMRQPFYSFHQSLELQFCITNCTEIWFLHLHIACKCLHLGSAVRIIVFLSIFELNFHVSFHFFGFCELSGYFSSRL